MTELRFLGTGWSHGVPTIGCSCDVCTERHPRNQRKRPSVHLQSKDTSLVVDLGADFRAQVLEYGVSHLDAVLITHAHADHVMGIDDVRRFTWHRAAPLPIYANGPTCERLRELLPYALHPDAAGNAVPQIRLEEWESVQTIGEVRVTPFRVPHGGIPCSGMRFDTPLGSIGYVPDCNDLPPHAREICSGVDVMILNALRLKPHPNHLSLEQSLTLLTELGAPVSILTHLGCPIDYNEVQPTLPQGFHLACDGMLVELSADGPLLHLP